MTGKSTRRGLLRLGAAGLAGSIAGCSGGRSDGTDTPSGTATVDGSETPTGGSATPDLTVRPEKRWDAEIRGDLRAAQFGPTYTVVVDEVETGGRERASRAYVFETDSGARQATFDLPAPSWGVTADWDAGVVALACHSRAVDADSTDLFRIDLDAMDGSVSYRFEGYPYSPHGVHEPGRLVFAPSFSDPNRQTRVFEYDTVAEEILWETATLGPSVDLSLPVGDRDSVFAAVGGRLYAFDRGDGSERWSVSLDRATGPLSYTGDAILFSDDPYALPAEYSGPVTVYSYGTDGRERWSTDLDVVPFGQVEASDGYYGVVARNSPDRRAEYVFTALAEGGEQLWSEPYGVTREATPGAAIAGGNAHVYSEQDYTIHDAESGEVRRRIDDSPASGSPTLIGGATVYGTEQTVRALDPSALDRLWEIDAASLRQVYWTEGRLALVLDTDDGVSLYRPQRS